MERPRRADPAPGPLRRFQEASKLESQPSTDLFQLEEYGNSLLSYNSGVFLEEGADEQEARMKMLMTMREQSHSLVEAQRAAQPSDGHSRDQRKGQRPSRLGGPAGAPTEASQQADHEYEAYHGQGAGSQQSHASAQSRHVRMAESPGARLRTSKEFARSDSIDEEEEEPGALPEALHHGPHGLGDNGGAPIGQSFRSEGRGLAVEDEEDGEDGPQAYEQQLSRFQQGNSKSSRRTTKPHRSRTVARSKRDLGQRSRTTMRISDISGDDLDEQEDFLTSVPPAAQDVLTGEPGPAPSRERPPLKWQETVGKLKQGMAPSSWETSTSDNAPSDDVRQSANRPQSASSVSRDGPHSSARPSQAVLRHLQAPSRMNSFEPQGAGASSPLAALQRDDPRMAALWTSKGAPAGADARRDARAEALAERRGSPAGDGRSPAEAEELRRSRSVGKAEEAELGDAAEDYSRSRSTPVVDGRSCLIGDVGAGLQEEDYAAAVERDLPHLLQGRLDDDDEDQELTGSSQLDDEKPQLERNLSLPHAPSMDSDGGGGGTGDSGPLPVGKDDMALERNLSLQGQGKSKKVPAVPGHKQPGAMKRITSFLKKPGAKEPGSASRNRPPKPSLMALGRAPGLMRQNSTGFQDLPAPKRVHFQLSELQLATDNFDKKNTLGQGGFGTVYYGLLPVKPAQQVAIKVLKHFGSHAEEEFNTELELLSRLDHKHLVKLMGFCCSGKDRLLVYEFMSNGSLYDHLHGKKRDHNGPLSWDRRLRIMVGAARGLRYLHAQRPQVLHRDIKAANILLTDKLMAKVADFGCAKLIRKTVSVENEETGEVVDRLVESVDVAMGTHGLMAPEILMTGEVSAAGDIYSFGVVLLEILSGLQPILHDKKQLVHWAKPLLEAARWEELVDPCILDERGGVSGVTGIGFKARVAESSALVRVAQLAHLCVNDEPMARPSIDEVAQAMQNIYFDKEAPKQTASPSGAAVGGAPKGSAESDEDPPAAGAELASDPRVGGLRGDEAASSPGELGAAEGRGGKGKGKGRRLFMSTRQEEA